MVRQVERSIQAEVMFRLKHVPLNAIVIGSCNGIYIPARTDAEKALVARIIRRLKDDGQMTVGCFDLLFLWGNGSGAIDLKRPARRTLFEHYPAGKPSDTQIEFATLCEKMGVKTAYCTSWPEVRDTLKSWGRIPADWLDAEQRIGRQSRLTDSVHRALS